MMDVNVDVAKNRAYYAALGPEDLCDCGYCRNFYRQVKAAYPLLTAYLAQMGIDIAKPLETSPIEMEEGAGVMYTCCQYVVLGSKPTAYQHQIGQVELGLAENYPSTGVAEEHFVLEIGPLCLKWQAVARTGINML